MAKESLSGKILDNMNKVSLFAEIFDPDDDSDELVLSFSARIGMGLILKSMSDDLCEVIEELQKFEENITKEKVPSSEIAGPKEGGAS